MAATVGCGSQGNSGVSGTITLDGAPLSTGRVSLAPTGSGTSASGGIVDGKYTVPLKVDAYPAAYVVRVSSPQPTGRMIAHPDGPNGKMEEIAEVIPPRYNAASELTITLNSASDHEFNFDLAAEPGRPNIVVIVADDLGYGDLSCLGQKNFQTPQLDRMAAEGMLLTDHYAGSTVCAPSRACLMTGQHTGHVFQRYNGSVQFREDPLDTTVATLLASGGYHTAMIGKSGLSCNSEDGGLPNRKGFDYFYGFVSHTNAHRYYPPSLWCNGEKLRFEENQGKEGAQYSGDLFLDKALNYLDIHQEGPFFLHLSLQQPHADLNVPKKWKKPFIGKFDEEPYPGAYYRGDPHPKATFAGMVTYLDHSVGQVLAKLKELGIAENTLVIFSSDNGPMSEGGWSRHYFDSSGPYRGGKRDLYEGGIRVPTIAWWPGKVAAGSKSDHISAAWDILPTACELAGVATPDNIDGISCVPTLLAQGNQRQHEYLYWEFYEQGGKQAIRRGNWKAVRLNVSDSPVLELYNLASDPGEANDVSEEHPEVVAELLAAMQEAHVESEVVRLTNKKKAGDSPDAGKNR
ncbi:Arylsulfatase A (ASA) (Cerebroside-sulfatase) [Durusdinium trenchii]|uniref:Arylsulfatase A (ASA) (Cerebroside-sulfatase) n=1 Tax=Durusdinium trenchii TaxID=1381693 RepID=A0ABP0LFM6_9DINO